MQWPLVLAALAMGVASSPHCAAMCAGPCAAVSGACARNATGLQAGRLLGYMAAGAVAAGSVSSLAAWSQAAPVLRPIWTLLHLAFLALGLWWLATGQQPAWLRRDESVPVRFIGRAGKPLRAGIVGLAWVAWPCGSLQAALMLAALGNGPQAGALVMGAFALGSMPALVAGPWMWRQWQARSGGVLTAARASALGYRLAGLALAAASGWALTHGLWERFAAWCAS